MSIGGENPPFFEQIVAGHLKEKISLGVAVLKEKLERKKYFSFCFRCG